MPTITVYGKPNCTYCDQAKQLLQSRSINYTYVELDSGQPHVEGQLYIDRNALLNLFPTARTMPQIMINAQPVGGFEQLRAYLEENQP